MVDYLGCFIGQGIHLASLSSFVFGAAAAAAATLVLSVPPGGAALAPILGEAPLFNFPWALFALRVRSTGLLSMLSRKLSPDFIGSILA